MEAAKEKIYISGNFLMLCAMVFIVVCNSSVYYSLHVYLQSLGLPPARSGLVISFQALAAMVMYGLFSSRVQVGNAFKFIAVGTAVMFLCGWCYLVANSFGQLSILRLIQGAGGFSLFAPCTVLLVHIIPRGREGSAFSLYSAAMLLPYSILPSLTDMVTPWVKNPAYLYVFTASLMMLVALMAWRLHNSLKLGEHDFSAKEHPSTLCCFGNLRHPVILATLLTNLFYFMIFTGIFFLFQDFARSRGIGNPGIFFTVQMGVMVFIRLTANRLFDRVSPRMIIFVALVITAGALGALPFLEDATLLLPLAVFFGLGMGLCTPPLNSLMYLSGDPEFRGFNANMMVLTIQFGSFLGPSVGSAMVEAVGYNAFLSGAAIATLVVGVVFLLVVPPVRKAV